ncbi:MAG: hypothetical protein ED859_14075 [Desulfuromonadales bacterium]|nr:MAG: hypothetical protein ED859_14075 [Desulfuromonadales bacterium]
MAAFKAYKYKWNILIFIIFFIVAAFLTCLPEFWLLTKDFFGDHAFLTNRFNSKIEGKAAYFFFCIILIGMLLPNVRLRLPTGITGWIIRKIICPFEYFKGLTKTLSIFAGLSAGIFWYYFIVIANYNTSVVFFVLGFAFILGQYYVLVITDNYESIVSEVQRHFLFKLLVVVLLIGTTIRWVIDVAMP